MLKHFLTGEEFSSHELKELIDLSLSLKQNLHDEKPLKGGHIALVFDKPSLRTRFSFTIAARELGGDVVESLSETRKYEEPEDMARVLSGFCKAIVLRTHEDALLTRMAKFSGVPIINALSAEHHPCQILADLLTIKETFGMLEGIKVCYIGNGNNNVLHSLLLMAPQVGVDVHFATPLSHAPKRDILDRCLKDKVFAHLSPITAVKGAHVIYTDVWTSMGFEKTSDETAFKGFQVNEKLMRYAATDAIFLHCMPMCRGKEVSNTLPDLPCSAIFQQSANRLPAQKALLIKVFS